MAHFLFTVDLPAEPTVEFMSMIPSQRAHVNALLEEGVVVSYSLSESRTRLWVIIVAVSVSEAESVLRGMPLASYFRYTVQPLMFHQSSSLQLNRFSLN